MLAQEPALFLLTLYLSLVYGTYALVDCQAQSRLLTGIAGLLYLTFEAFPISFQEEKGWNEGCQTSVHIEMRPRGLTSASIRNSRSSHFRAIATTLQEKQDSEGANTNCLQFIGAGE